MTVRITPNDKGNPTGKLADAELHFAEGPLEGLKLIGFSVWEQRRGGGGGRVSGSDEDGQQDQARHGCREALHCPPIYRTHDRPESTRRSAQPPAAAFAYAGHATGPMYEFTSNRPSVEFTPYATTAPVFGLHATLASYPMV